MRKFTFDDQVAFANLSGDCNPLHIDPVAARRLIYGGLVVHGIHALLWALDNWLEKNMKSLFVSAVKAEFQKPIRIDEEVSYSLKSQDEKHVEIELLTKGSTALWMEIEWKPCEQTGCETLETKLPERGICREFSADEVKKSSGSLDLFVELELLTSLFPSLSRFVSPTQIAEILATTRLVGMECPGLNSVYSGLNLVFSSEAESSRELTWKVESFDTRFCLLSIRVRSLGMEGIVKAFFRPSPQKQVSIENLSEQVNSNEFTGQNALIIGGTRGLGEVTAKVLAAGGADIKITYYKGLEDAQRIVGEIVSYGGQANCIAFDVLNPPEDLSDKFGKQWSPTHLYYFATPFISDAVRGKFSTELFQKFLDYYVTGFLKAVEILCNSGANLKAIFFPSSVFVDEIPLNMGEYAAAKMAGEMLCRFLEKTNPGIDIYKPRLPKTVTDQTVSFLPVDSVDPVTLMLKNLRNMRDAFSKYNS